MNIVAAITDGMKNPGEVVLITTVVIGWFVYCVVNAFVHAIRNSDW